MGHDDPEAKEPTMLKDAVESFLETRSYHEVLNGRLGGANIEAERGTFFVFQQRDHGRLILGHGPTVKQAVDAAIENYEG